MTDPILNPLLADWQTPEGAPPFDLFEPAHFMPAYEQGMREQNEAIAKIANNPAPATFENTIAAMELADATLSRVNLVFDCLSNNHTNDALDEIDLEITPKLTAHNSAIYQNAKLFERVQAVYDTRTTLPPQAQRATEKMHRSFIKSGAALNDDDKIRMAAIGVEISTLATQFGQNVSADEKAYALKLETEADRAGLSDSFLQAATAAGALRGLENTPVATLSMSSSEAFMVQSANRDLREQLYTAKKARGRQGGDTDNRAIMEKIAGLRQQTAALMGYESYADYQLSDKMAETPAAVHKLHDDVWQPARAALLRDRELLEEVARADGLNGDLQPWDWMYYAEKVRQQKYDVNEQEVRSYLTLDRGLEAAFYTANQLFGLNFTERHDLPVYHPDVRTWDVTGADGEKVAIFYGDYFARPSKRGGAWMSELRFQNSLTGDLPIITNTCNFAKPADGQPALLSIDDYAGTLFHEFGHALHGMLGRADYPSLSGTNVLRDFVELPSQLFEKWGMTEELLTRFALHHETGEPMPKALREKIEAANTFNQGHQTAEYLASSVVDMILHSQKAGEAKTVDEINAEMVALLDLPPQVRARHEAPHFGHIARGYAAGYYSYRWADVLVSDAFDAFRETGNVFDKATAKRLHDFIYSAGDSRPPQELYRAFRGRDADIKPHLRDLGFTPAPNAAKPKASSDAASKLNL